MGLARRDGRGQGVGNRQPGEFMARTGTRNLEEAFITLLPEEKAR